MPSLSLLKKKWFIRALLAVNLLLLVVLIMKGVVFLNQKPSNSILSSQNLKYERDLAYGERPEEVMDLFWLSEAASRPYPVIFWVHGGGYISGDKSFTEDYLARLAQEGYLVANINYALAPQEHYPVPVKQLGKAYQYLMSNHQQYPLDKSVVFFGGDSAGAQIALQFVNIQTSREYAKRINIKPVVTAESIKGAISLSGLLDLERFTKTSSAAANQSYKKAGELYFSDPRWQVGSSAKQASLNGNVSSGFPATFLTDGNQSSFEDQARDLENELQQKGVEATSRFYDPKDALLGHQFQFDLSLKQSKDTLEALIDFLNQQSKN